MRTKRKLPSWEFSLFVLAILLCVSIISTAQESPFPLKISIPQKLTSGPLNHFFGYYGISPWDAAEKRMLALETEFHDRLPEADDVAVIGYVDMDSGEYVRLTETRAWNLQQGAMQRWLPPDNSGKIIFNDCREGKLVSVVYNIADGSETVLPRPLSDLSSDGKTILSINYARLRRKRPVTGYAGVADATEGVDQPEDDGIFSVSVESVDEKLLFSIADVVREYRSAGGKEDLTGKELWIAHTEFNPSGARFMFLMRYSTGMGTFRTGLFSADSNGQGIRLLVDYGHGVSHFEWLTDDELLITMDREGGAGMEYVVVDGSSGEALRKIGEGDLVVDGHPSLRPGGRFLVTDTYPRSMKESLIIYDLADNKMVVPVKFKHSPKYVGAVRCDLHPRWSGSGKMIAVDSIHDGSRQVYMLKVEDEN